jgi:hypothetical protein
VAAAIAASTIMGKITDLNMLFFFFATGFGAALPDSSLYLSARQPVYKHEFTAKTNLLF